MSRGGAANRDQRPGQLLAFRLELAPALRPLRSGLGGSSLHRATPRFGLHYRRERNPQGPENQILRPEFAPFPSAGALKCRRRLGGRLNYYHREAASKTPPFEFSDSSGCQDLAMREGETASREHRLGRWQGWLSIQPRPHGLLQMRRGKWLRQEHPILAGLKIGHDGVRVAAAHID